MMKLGKLMCDAFNDSFDCIILLYNLWTKISLFQYIILNYAKSYIKHRNLAVNIGKYSSSAIMTSRVLQRQILEPVSFSLYIPPLGQILQHNISFHCCANYLQLYLLLNPGNHYSRRRLKECILDIKKKKGSQIWQGL